MSFSSNAIFTISEPMRISKYISTQFVVASILSLTFSSLSFSQMSKRELLQFIETASEAELVTQNSTYMMEGYLYFSDLMVDKLLVMNPESCNYQYRKGFTSLMVRHDYVGAIPLFEKAITKINNNYDMFSPKEENAPSDAYFYLATCYHLNEEIEKAEGMYQKFLDETKKRSELKPVASLRLLQCAIAKKQMGSPVSVKLKNVGSQINTNAPEYSPVVSLDGSALYFTTRRDWPDGLTFGFNDPERNQAPEDVYVSYLDFDSEWTEPTRLGFCQAKRNEATSAVSTDERRIYLYMDSTGGGDIYFADIFKARFDEIKEFTAGNVNTKYWETHCMISQDKRMMYFVSDRPDGFGGRDIYYCTQMPNGEWSSPINMGPSINSAFDEDAPFISIDNKTLYFASNGPKSMGGFDIMKSELGTSGIWSESANLGYPFNSTDDDIFYTTTVDGLKGYMTSYRKGGYGEKDIYEIQNDYLGIQNYSILQGHITAENGSTLDEDVVIVVNVTCLDCDVKTTRVVYPRVRDGFYLSGLEPCRNYLIEYQNLSNSKAVYRDSFQTACDSLYQIIKKELRMNADYTIATPQDKENTVVQTIEEKVIEKIERPTPKEYVNLNFKQYLGFNKNQLLTSEGELKIFLDNIARQLKEGRQSITIEIYASASTVPTASFKNNDLLAQKRAENIKNSLLTHFAGNPNRGKITIEIVEAIVQGPAYTGDFDNEEKYGPYQYVALKTK
jgi:tetratricopeptide (TPR) repeat protein/outer membrane protein OmpA-like peptidoglycan-associated protein